MADEFEVLKISLQEITVGYLMGYRNGKNAFIFDQNYQNDANRLTLTLTTYNEFPKSMNLLKEVWRKKQKLHPVFSNLLPEGSLREWLSRELKIHNDNEFPLLALLGRDLPGAIVATAMKPEDIPDYVVRSQKGAVAIEMVVPEKENRFSLAGEQMKFSMKENKDGRYHVSQEGELGSWIIKTPSTRHQFVPMNEYTAMSLASSVGVDVPDMRLIKVKALEKLPPINLPDEELAYAIKRYDRGEDGIRIHAEDFAQVFFNYPHDKYHSANYEQIARALYIYSARPLLDIQQMAIRLLVNILVGNGDAHLKNWSLIYNGGFQPELSPAYDILSTHVYIEKEKDFALNLVGNKSWHQANFSHFEKWAKKSKLPWKAILPTLEDVMTKARAIWPEMLEKSGLTDAHKASMKAHWRSLHKDFKIKS